MFKRFLARRYNGGLPVRNCRTFQSSGIRKITRGSASRRGQPRVSFNLHVNAFRFSGHGNSPGERRRLPGNPDSSRDRLRPCARCAALCRSRSIFRKYNDLLACRTSRNGQNRAWEPPGKTVPERGKRGKACAFHMRRISYWLQALRRS